MKRNFKLTISYDGTRLKGWQFQPSERTVQGDIENEFSKLFKDQKINLIGSGRTDSGVHAFEQIANIRLDTDWKNDNIRNALNANTIGSYNTASGSFALNINTSGNNNTASGFESLFSNTTGSSNTATGKGALYSSTTGDNNTATGVYLISFRRVIPISLFL